MRRILWTALCLCGMATHIALCLFSAHSIMTTDLNGMEITYVSNLASDLIVLITCSCVFASTLIDRHFSKNSFVFLHLLTFEAILLALDIQNWILDGNLARMDACYTVNYLIYTMIVVLAVTFWIYLYYLFPFDRKRILRDSVFVIAFAAIDIGLIAYNHWSGIFFTIDVDGRYQRADTFVFSMVLPILISIVEMWIILRNEKGLRRRITLLSFLLIPFAAGIIQAFTYGISLQYISIMLALLLMYANIYVSRSAELIVNESEMLEQRARAMVSQIQPHFLYNVLTSIMNIKGCSEESREAIVDFSRYLRFNLDSIRNTNPIPISAEVEHVERYINMRRLHYGDKLDFDSDISDREIHIPAQALKMIAESLMEPCIEQADYLILRVDTVREGKNHVITIGHSSPTLEMGEFTESERFRDLGSTLERLEKSVGCRYEYRYVEDECAEMVLTIPAERRLMG